MRKKGGNQRIRDRGRGRRKNYTTSPIPCNKILIMHVIGEVSSIQYYAAEKCQL